MRLIMIIVVALLAGCSNNQNGVGVAGDGGNRGAVFGVGVSTGIGF